MIVRAVTPPGAYGRVFWLRPLSASTSPGIVAPIIFRPLLYHGHLREIFFVYGLVPARVFTASSARRRNLA